MEQFTEADSPVRLIEPDQAWTAMQQKLDAEWPAVKRTPAPHKWWWLGAGLGAVMLIALVLLWKKPEGSRQSVVGSPQESGAGSRESGAGSAVDSPESIVDSLQESGVRSRESGASRQSVVDSRKSIVDSSKSVVDGRAPVADSRKPEGTISAGDIRDKTMAGTTAGDRDRGRAVTGNASAGNGKRTHNSTGAGKTTGNANKTVVDNTAGSGKPRGSGKGTGRTGGTGKTTDTDKLTRGRSDITGHDNHNDIKQTRVHDKTEQQPGQNDDLRASTTFYLQPAIQAIDVAGHVASLPRDSSMAKATVPDNKKAPDPRRWEFAAALQWAAVLPAAGNSFYSTGPGGSSQVYRHLLPAVAFTVQKNRHRAGISLYPFLQTQLNDKSYLTTEDTMGRAVRSYSLVKMFGYGAGLSYAYNLYGNWWLGAGVQANWWSKGLIHYRQGGTAVVPKDTLLLAGRSDSSWKQFASHQYRVDLEAWYDRRRWALGLQASMPLVKPVQLPGAVNIRQPVSVALLFRWKLYRR